MDLEQQPAVGRQRVFIVLPVRAVRGPHLDEGRTRAGHDVRDPERAADLDQLPARHERRAAARQRGEGEQHGAGGVVDDERVGGARQLAEQVAAVRVP